MRPRRVALVTAAEARGIDEDLPLALAACDRAGLDVTVEDWDDPGVDWSAMDLAVVRSTWDYTSRLDEFLAWAERVDAACAIRNPVAVLRWNTDKRYLRDLAAAGVPVVPSTFVEVGARVVDLPDDVELVVKPTVSAGSRDTARYGRGRHDAVASHVAELHAAGRVAMVQPYRGVVDTAGETSVLCFGGEVSHAIRKGPLLTIDAAPSRALFAPEHITPRDPAPDELEATETVLDALRRMPALGLDRPLLYARVDLLRTDDGGLEVLEVELTEPSLFLDRSAGAADRFAAAVRVSAADARPGPGSAATTGAGS
jgi:O-ureido-D-serine cyclo-ligase